MASISKKVLAKIRKRNKIKHTEKRMIINLKHKNNYKYCKRTVIRALNSGVATLNHLYKYRSVVDRLRQKGLIHKNAASRLKSRMHLKFNQYISKK